MGGTTSSSRNDHGKSQTKTSAKHLSESVDAAASSGEQQRTRNQHQTTAAATSTTQAAEESAAGAAAAQRLRQTSTWSLGSLSGRLNWSFTGASRNSFRNRNKATRKSFTSLQQRRSKTVWHKPLTNAIFSTHFKESSRNEQFHIEHLVAKGAFGVVFRVIDKRTVSDGDHSAVPYALKVLKKSKIIEENSVQQIKDEADIQKLCGHHPFIVQQVDLWQNRRNLHILSEYVPNGELFSKIAQFSIDLIRVYLAEIALAIDFLHNAGIIYRDAKPENILLTESFHIKLTDFGLSKWLKLGVTTKTMCGTFQYMAPEILRGEAYGHSVDWWSLGIIACQMFTGMGPDIKQFLSAALPSIHTNGDSVDNAVHSMVNGEDENFLHLTHIESELESQNLPHEAKDVLKRLLTVDPRQRLRSVMALQRIALYKNFKIDSKHLLSISLQDIISKDNIIIYKDNHYDETSSVLAAKAFKGF